MLLARSKTFLLLGSDSWQDLPNWHQPEQICQLATPIVVNRAGEADPSFNLTADFLTAEQLTEIRQHHVVMPSIDLTSSDLRARAASGKSLTYRTPAAVEQYIRQHELYRATS